MIRRLRWKLVAITMVLLSVMLAVIMGFVQYSVRSGLYQDSLERMEDAGMRMGRPHGPGSSGSMGMGQCFVLERMPDGRFHAMGPEDLLADREALEALLEEARKTGARTGELEIQGLRFLRLDDGPGEKYAFMDITSEKQTIARLDTTCIMIAVVGLLGFFGISVLLARWAVRPVEQAWDQQRRFVADASHELKTPLTVILTNAELLTDPEPQEDRDRFAENILIMSRQMRGLVEELLDQARVDDGAARTQWEPLDLSKLVSDAVLPFEPVYFEAGRCLESQIQPGLRTDGNGSQLRRVVEILLDNGCKYSAAGGTVYLRLKRERRSCLLSVTSPGVALTEQQQEDIFKRFYRVDAARKMDRSYGLGLSIAKAIVEQHRGKIWVQSQEGQNTFFVSLPI